MDIIDPPVGPYSSYEELVQWRTELQTMPQSTERDWALEDVTKWIEWRSPK